MNSKKTIAILDNPLIIFNPKLKSTNVLYITAKSKNPLPLRKFYYTFQVTNHVKAT